MNNILPKMIKGKPFTYKEACHHGLSQYSIRKLLETGEIERLEHGLYRVTNQDISEENMYRAATRKAGQPAVVCLLSALSYYDLTDIIPKQVWLMVPKEKRVKSLSIKLYRARDPHWKVGVVSKEGYSITSLERTIIDSLTLKTLRISRLGIDALKLAVTNKKTSASRILQMASDLGVKHRVLPYIEVLA